MFKIGALTKAVGNGMCLRSKRHKSKGGPWADYAKKEFLPQISKSCTLPLTQKKENNTRINPTLTQNKKPPNPKDQGVQTSTLQGNVSNFSYIFFCLISKYKLLYFFIC